MKTNAQLMFNEAIHCRIHQIIHLITYLTGLQDIFKNVFIQAIFKMSHYFEFCTNIICWETFVYGVFVYFCWLLFLNLTIMKTISLHWKITNYRLLKLAHSHFFVSRISFMNSVIDWSATSPLRRCLGIGTGFPGNKSQYQTCQILKSLDKLSSTWCESWGCSGKGQELDFVVFIDSFLPKISSDSMILRVFQLVLNSKGICFRMP